MTTNATRRMTSIEPYQPEPGLPAAPSDEEFTAYIWRGRALLTTASAISFVCLLFSQAHFVLNAKWLTLLLPYFLFTLAYYLISLVMNFHSRDFDLRAHRLLVSGWRPPQYPSVDVFLPICREDLPVLRNTWEHVDRLRAAYQGPCHIYVLDDGDEPQAAALAADYGFDYRVRENRGWFKKAGNLRFGFEISDGTYILIFDADFAPRADLPEHLLSYLEADPSLGIVQSPQYFRSERGQSWVERGAVAVQELFYRVAQVSRDQLDAAICVGSCAAYRRTALASNGGATLIGDSEDVHTGFDLRRHGWGLRYIPIPLAAGLCPPGPDAFLVQQYRWCKGSMSLLGSRKFWAHKMRWRTRACYLSGFCYYAHTAVSVLIAPVIPIVLLAFLPDRVRAVNYVLIYPSLLFNFAVFPAWHHTKYGPSALMVKFLYGWAHLFALWDIARRRPMAWRPTGSRAARSANRRFWVAIGAYSGTSAVLWLILALYRMTELGAVAFAMLFGTGLLNALIVGMALGSGRQAARATDQASIIEPTMATVQTGSASRIGRTEPRVGRWADGRLLVSGRHRGAVGTISRLLGATAAPLVAQTQPTSGSATTAGPGAGAIPTQTAGTVPTELHVLLPNPATPTAADSYQRDPDGESGG